MALCEVRVNTGQDVSSQTTSAWLLCGMADVLDEPTGGASGGPAGTFCNQPWQELFDRTSLTPSDLWDSTDVRCAATAKLFPVAFVGRALTVRDVLWLQPGSARPDAAYLRSWRSAWRLSWQQLLRLVDNKAEFARRQELQFAVSAALVAKTLHRPVASEPGQAAPDQQGAESSCILPYLRAFALHGNTSILQTLDSVAMDTPSPGVAARALACIADMLGMLAGDKGGLRSGPGRNQLWHQAFALLENDTHEQRRLGVQALARQRAHWMSTPEALIRAARHYESAAQILIRLAVMTARKFIDTKPGATALGPGHWIVAETPARIDLAGGWTDTPPITYEHGGAVTNAAILIDGQRPIGAKVRQIPTPFLLLVMGDVRIEVSTLDQLRTYNQPQSPGALLKAAFCCAGLVSGM